MSHDDFSDTSDYSAYEYSLVHLGTRGIIPVEDVHCGLAGIELPPVFLTGEQREFLLEDLRTHDFTEDEAVDAVSRLGARP